MEQLAHELSNSLGLMMDYLVLDQREGRHLSEHLITATGLAVRSAEGLRQLMLDIYVLRLGLKALELIGLEQDGMEHR